MEDIGALWARKSAKGDDYFSGVVTIEGVVHQLVLFKNNRKSKPNHPDWHIFPSSPKPELNPNGTEKVDTSVAPF